LKARSISPEVLRGVEVAVASTRSEILLGVREGLIRYFHRALDRPVPVAVVPQEVADVPLGVASSDSEIIGRCRERVGELEGRLDDAYQFYVAVEEGIETLHLEDTVRHYVRSWAVIQGLGSYACGGSGSFEVPRQLLEESVTGAENRRKPAGLRRQAGLVATLSGGLDSRRSAAASAVFNAVAGLFFELYSGHPRSAN
jgi:non-canonical (house-cleaning) NTP pyrophosphatase